MKEDELHMYDFMGDNGDEDGGIMLASEYMFQFGEIIVENSYFKDSVWGFYEKIKALNFDSIT